MRPIYQPQRIVRALIELARGGVDFEFTFAADGSETSTLTQMVRSAGLDEKFRFLLGYDNEDLPVMLADADIYVSASLWDGTSPALLEAMASGAFPVVSDITSNREWLTGSGDSLFFDPCREDALLQCLKTAIDDVALRRDAVTLLRQRVMAEGDRQANMAKLAEYYELLVETRPVANAV
jgi:glycosyltransferase involved in cell wall biosynthesis